MSYDIAIIGAGPAGLGFARLLVDTGLRMVLVEKQSVAELAEPPVDGRDIALTHLSKKILEEIGVWQRFPADSVSPLREARVVDGTSPYTLSFDSAKDGLDALGYLVANHLIRRALYEAVSESISDLNPWFARSHPMDMNEIHSQEIRPTLAGCTPVLREATLRRSRKV